MLCCIFLASFSLLGWVSAESCRYERLSTQHSFCKKPNATCNISHSGIKKKDIEEILKIHNVYRNDLALGKETRAKGGVLPKASDMMQMVWDDELASIAQKWANNCVYQHDCHECRSVEDYRVGQNIAYQDWLCSEKVCQNAITQEQLEPEWEKVILDFYMEVKDFDTREQSKFHQNPNQVIGHFTQIIWAQTWRVGCGFTVFKTGFNYRRFYVCNYGPTGNMLDEPIYKVGEPCSGCPINSCCGKSCKGKVEYPGLCKMKNSTKSPIYKRNTTDLIFDCNGNRNSKDCAASVSGTDKWIFKNNLLGNYASIVLKGGENSTVHMKNPLMPSQENFCLRMLFRKGPLKAGQPDRSHLAVDFHPTGYLPVHMSLSLTSQYYVPFSLDLNWKAKTTFTFTFSVDEGASPQVLAIKEIIAFNGKCNSKTI